MSAKGTYTGGPAFIAPLLQGPVLSPLLEALPPSETPSKLLIATLRTLNQIADAVAQEKPWAVNTDAPSMPSLWNEVCEQIYTRPVVESMSEILAQPARTTAIAQEISLAAKLIAKTCREEDQRQLLLDGGVLSHLETKLAAMAAVDAQALRMEPRPVSADVLPEMYLPDLLEAIAAIIKDSHYNTACFIYSPPMMQVFGSGKDGDGPFASNQATPWDRLTPRLHTLHNKSDPYTKAWPALGAYVLAGNSETFARVPSADTIQTTSRTIIADESETPLFIWLMSVARRSEGRARLSACWLLALLKKFGEKWPLNDPSKITRERHFAYLIVPLVAKMIEESNPASDNAKKNNPLCPQSSDENRFVLERSPLVLAELVAGNKTLQTAAVDAGVLMILVQMLKKSFDPIQASTKRLWSPKPAPTEVPDPMVDEASSTLGRPGVGSELLHAFRYRESALLALAAMADTQDGLRKCIIDIGAATHIIECLVPYSDSPPSSTAQTGGANSSSLKIGNPVPVLIAACKVTRSLSRSISVLRTSLIDHGIAQPSFDLLNHPDVGVQIAATEVITNLVLEVSPMRTVSLIFPFSYSLCRRGQYHLHFSSKQCVETTRENNSICGVNRHNNGRIRSCYCSLHLRGRQRLAARYENPARA